MSLTELSALLAGTGLLALAVRIIRCSAPVPVRIETPASDTDHP